MLASLVRQFDPLFRPLADALLDKEVAQAARLKRMPAITPTAEAGVFIFEPRNSSEPAGALLVLCIAEAGFAQDVGTLLTLSDQIVSASFLRCSRPSSQELEAWRKEQGHNPMLAALSEERVGHLTKEYGARKQEAWLVMRLRKENRDAAIVPVAAALKARVLCTLEQLGGKATPASFHQVLQILEMETSLVLASPADSRELKVPLTTALMGTLSEELERLEEASAGPVWAWSTFQPATRAEWRQLRAQALSWGATRQDIAQARAMGMASGGSATGLLSHLRLGVYAEHGLQPNFGRDAAKTLREGARPPVTGVPRAVSPGWVLPHEFQTWFPLENLQGSRLAKGESPLLCPGRVIKGVGLFGPDGPLSTLVTGSGKHFLVKDLLRNRFAASGAPVFVFGGGPDFEAFVDVTRGRVLDVAQRDSGFNPLGLITTSDHFRVAESLLAGWLALLAGNSSHDAHYYYSMALQRAWQQAGNQWQLSDIVKALTQLGGLGQTLGIGLSEFAGGGASGTLFTGTPLQLPGGGCCHILYDSYENDRSAQARTVQTLLLMVTLRLQFERVTQPLRPTVCLNNLAMLEAGRGLVLECVRQFRRMGVALVVVAQGEDVIESVLLRELHSRGTFTRWLMLRESYQVAQKLQAAMPFGISREMCERLATLKFSSTGSELLVREGTQVWQGCLTVSPSETVVQSSSPDTVKAYYHARMDGAEPLAAVAQVLVRQRNT